MTNEAVSIAAEGKVKCKYSIRVLSELEEYVQAACIYHC